MDIEILLKIFSQKMELGKIFTIFEMSSPTVTRLREDDLTLIVPKPLVWGGTVYSNASFLLRQFWPIDIYIVEKCAWYH